MPRHSSFEPKLEIKKDKSDDLDNEMFTIDKVKIEPGLEIKKEKSDGFDSEMFTIYEVKIEPKYEVNLEVNVNKCEDFDNEMSVDRPKLKDDTVVQNIVVIKSWLKAVPFQSVVEGSPFVPFKMPFIGTNLQPCRPEKLFDIAELLKAFPNIGLIVDLSNYRRTYRTSELSAFGVQYVNIPVRFKGSNSIPSNKLLSLFIETCSRYSTLNSGKLIGVHDQLGNRATAYMICKALEKGGLSMKQAMERFKDARGHPIYAAMAGVLNGSRRPWIPKSNFNPEFNDLDTKQWRKLKKQRNKCRKLKKERKAERKKAKMNDFGNWIQPKYERPEAQEYFIGGLSIKQELPE